MSLGNRIRTALAYLAALCWGVASSAQTFTGTIVGRVVDSKQLAVPGASLTLRSAERGFDRQTIANAHGEYAFEVVPPGRFSVRAEASGFAPTTAIVEVVVATPVRANLVLRVQPLKEEINVMGESGVSVQTENASQGRVVSPREMTELPSIGRSPYDFMALMAGATLSNDGAGVGFAVSHGFPRPVFNRNQFGGTSGGPIRQGKLFYFVALESILVRSSGWNPFYVPTPQLLDISSPATQAIFERFPLPNNLSSVNVRQETLCPFGTSCVAQTGAGYVKIPAFAFAARLGPQDFGGGFPQNTILAVGRLDWMLGTKTQAFLRYAIENKNEFAAANQSYSSNLDQPAYGYNQNVAINVIHTWSPTLATETRIAYDRVTGDPDRIGGNAYIVPSPPLPFFHILNESVILPGGSPSAFGPLNGYQFFQTVTYSRARHTLRFGGQYIYMRQNITFGVAGEIADAQFPNTQAFVDGSLSLFHCA